MVYSSNVLLPLFAERRGVTSVVCSVAVLKSTNNQSTFEICRTCDRHLNVSHDITLIPGNTSVGDSPLLNVMVQFTRSFVLSIHYTLVIVCILVAKVIVALVHDGQYKI